MRLPHIAFGTSGVILSICFLVFFTSSVMLAQDETNLCTLLGNGASLEQLAQFGRGDVADLAVSPAGTTLAVAGSAGVWFYNADTLTPLHTLQTDDNEQANSLAWSSDSTRLAVSYVQSKTMIWDVERGDILVALDIFAQHVSWSATSTLLATVDPTGAVVVWDAVTGELLKVYSSRVKTVAWSPDGTQLAIANTSNEGTATDIYLWDVAHEAQPVFLQTVEGNGQEQHVTWSPDGARLAVGSDQSPIVTLVTVEGERSIKTLEVPMAVSDVAWSPTGEFVALSGEGDTPLLLLWDIQGDTIQELEGHTQTVTTLMWSPDGKRLFSASADSTIRGWDVVEGREIGRIDEYWQYVGIPAWSPDGTKLAVIYAQTNGATGVTIWDIATGDIVWAAEEVVASFRSVWSPDGTRLAIPGQHLIQIWDIGNGDTPLLEIPADEYSNAVWSPDSSRLASIPSIGMTIRLWDAATGQELQTLDTHGSIPDARAVWTAEGLRWVAYDTNAILAVWEAGQEQPIFVLDDASIQFFPFLLPSGQLLVADYQIWSIAERQIVAPYYASSVNGVGSTDEDCIAAVSHTAQSTDTLSQSVIHLWDVIRRHEIATLTGHGAFDVVGLAWSPDGTQLASAGRDGTVRVWGVE